MKKVIMVAFLLYISVFLIACKGSQADDVSNNGKLTVSITFNALAEFAEEVGQDKVEVSTIIPAGTEPHDFEPKAADIAGISKAKVFIRNGLGMDTWTEDAIKAAGNTNLVVITAADGAKPIQNADQEAMNEQGQSDPHLWLSIKGAEMEVANIADGLSKADPANKDYYQDNAKGYISQLEDLYNLYKDKFAALSNKNFVTGHAAFHYFCNDFGLTQSSVEDVFAEGEPSTKQLAKLVDYCKTNHVTTVFAEKMSSPEVSQTLANEVGANVETIYTMEGPEDNLSFLERMKDNCERIYNSLSK
jgi:ABC-type metal ion transport system, periplasmic component/surface adhesin